MEKHYELTYTTQKNLPPEEATTLYEKMLADFPNALKKDGGYDFFTLEFSALPEALGELEKNLKAKPQIKKYLIVRREPVRMAKVRREKPIRITEPKTEPKVEKSEIKEKEIDQKLKEIFGE